MTRNDFSRLCDQIRAHQLLKGGGSDAQVADYILCMALEDRNPDLLRISSMRRFTSRVGQMAHQVDWRPGVSMPV